MTTGAEDDATPSPLDRVNQLARIAEALESGEAPASADGQWLAAALRSYIQDAPLGMAMEDAMGITAKAGQCAWWRLEARGQRNAAIIELHQRLFADLAIPRAAKEIALLVRSVQQKARPGIGRSMRNAAVPDPQAETLVNAALLTGLPFPGPKQIANILEINTPS